MAGKSIFRKTYDSVALVALLNMVAVVGATAYLLGVGAIDGDRVRRIAMVLRGESEPPAVQEKSPEEEAKKSKQNDEKDAAVPASQVDLEIMRREAERIKEELRQQLALNNSILLRVRTERESFERERKTAIRKDQASKKQHEREGFRKQIAIIEGLKPKNAVVQLLGFPDQDEAARILLEIDTRRAQKIVQAAKGSDQTRKMMDLLQRVREVAPDRSKDLLAKK